MPDQYRETGPFVGRRAELAALEELLDHARLVTLTGLSGIGKSRLARALLRTARSRFLDGVFLVELDSVADSRLVPEIVLGALGTSATFDVGETVVEDLAGVKSLLVLDGCERVIATLAPFVDTLLGACSGLRVLVTSQMTLGLAGEHVIALGPLACPHEPMPEPEELISYDAAALFLERVRSSWPSLAIDGPGAAAVGRICRRLEGIPLALELVAPRVAAIGLEALATAVEARGFLAEEQHPDTRPARHLSLESALSWSLDLLTLEDHQLLATLSVFSGGCDAEALARVSSEAGVRRTDVVDGLSRLVARSLVSVRRSETSTRYELLEIVRQHLRADLEADGRLEEVSRHHLAWCQSLAAGAGEALISGPDERRWLERLGEEQANLRAALDFSLDTGDSVTAGYLARDLWRYWELRGQLSEGRRSIERILAAGQLDPSLEVRLLDGLGMLAWRQGDLARASVALEDALRSARELGDESEAGRLRNHLGLVALFSGNMARAKELFARSLADFERLDSPGEIALVVANIALVAIEEGRLEDACNHLERSLALSVAIGDRHGWAISLLHRSIARFYLADLDCACEDAEEAARAFLELGDERSLAFALLVIAAALARVRPSFALELAGLSGTLARRVGVVLPPGWDVRVEAALMPARLACAGEAEETTRRGATLDPSAALAAVRVQQTASLAPSALRCGGSWASVQTLGRFQVQRGVTIVRLAPQVARLVKLVAVRGQPVHVEEAIETLWPEVAPERGRRRLRNVLSRLVRHAGPLVVRDGEALVIASGVVLDSARFEAAASAALTALTTRNDPRGALDQARDALGCYRGDLLPEDAYEPFAITARERLRRRRLRILELAAAVACAEGHLDEAEAYLEDAVDADPTDEERYLSLARILLATGRPAAAATIISRARTMAAELGLPASPTLLALAARLQDGSAS
ncbi:MAG: BTAD domain-containing putative transcriptional regulator [Acidimicrobiales bacterium]